MRSTGYFEEMKGAVYGTKKNRFRRTGCLLVQEVQ